MPLPRFVENGYRGVSIRSTEKYGFAVVEMSNNRHRFPNQDEARAFVDDVIAREDRDHEPGRQKKRRS